MSEIQAHLSNRGLRTPRAAAIAGIIFASASVAGGVLAVYAFNPALLFGNGLYIFSQAMIYKFNNVYAIRMAGVHMLVLGTIWVRTQVMPRWLAFVTYALALIFIIGIGFYYWVTLAFPAWVFLISVYILILNYRHTQGEVSTDGLSLPD